MSKLPNEIELQVNPKVELDQLEKIKSAAEIHISFSDLYLRMLQSMSEAYGSEKNPFPWKTLKEGSYYLQNAYQLVKLYKNYIPSPIDDKNIVSINDMLVTLEFDPSHIISGSADEAYGEKAECFVSKGQDTKYYNLLHSELKKDIRSFIEMVELNIETPIKRFLESITKELQSISSKMLHEAIENDNLLAVEKCINKGVLVNFQDTDGKTPLHHAVNNGNTDIVRTLLKNGAGVHEVTNEGQTLLHIASAKGYKEVVEVLLQYVSRNKLNDFINAKTPSEGTTSLHIAAKNSFLGIVKSLLKHGAIYNIENNEGETPVNLSKDQKVINLLKIIDELFRDVKDNNIEAFSKIITVKPDEFLAITNAHSNQGNTLIQVAIANNKDNITESKLLKTLIEPYQIQPQFSFQLEFSQKLKSIAEVHMAFSRLYLQILRSMLETCNSEKNPFPLKTLKEGSYYLQNAYQLVKQYKDSFPCPIGDQNIVSINDMLVTLEFDPSHIISGSADEAYGEKAECFVSKGQDTKYYNLLHSELKKDIRSFIEMVELNIETPIKRFLESITKELQSISSKMLHEAIENDNLLAVEKCIDKGVLVNFQDTDGKTPLHHAVNNGNTDIVRTLLKNGAGVHEVTNEGQTLLHIASAKGNKEVVEVLLQYVSRNKLNDFINAKTPSEGTTSLHIAAKNSFLDIVKSLLKHGAIYNIENNEGETPVNLSKDQKVINLLKMIDELFRDVKDNNIEAFSKIITVKPDEFLAITNARNNQGNTLKQVNVTNNEPDVTEDKLLNITEDPYQAVSQPNPKLDWNLRSKALHDMAKSHLASSKAYLPILKSMSKKYNSTDSEMIPLPWKTLKEGSYYLQSAYKFVELYKDHVPDSIDYKNLKSVHDVLVELEFDPTHISSGYTDEAYNGMAECFVSKGQGTLYYNLLHSKFKKDVRSFIKMVELHIDIPVKNILLSTEARS